MKKLLPLVSVLLLHGIGAKAQTFMKDPFSETYKDLIKQAVSAYEGKEYLKSARLYAKAFATSDNGFATKDMYNSAGSWAMAGNSDSAFIALERIAGARNPKYNGMVLNTDLLSLHSDKRWNAFLDKVKASRIAYSPSLDFSLVPILDTILQDDQQYRLRRDAVKEKHGADSRELRSLDATIQHYDSLNIGKVERILDDRGWPSRDITGSEGQSALFLVIQHAELATQEKYLPQIRDAVQQHALPRSYLATLEDRIAISKGEQQTYGTQVGTDKDGRSYLEPLADPGNVNKRRAEVGMDPLEDYLKSMGINYPDPK